MNRIDFNKYNRILGISTGILSFIVFALTVEPTASYWDCAEYISTSAKLQIGHPPGAPLFQMLGAIFSIFALEALEIKNKIKINNTFFFIIDYKSRSTTILLFVSHLRNVHEILLVDLHS